MALPRRRFLDNLVVQIAVLIAAPLLLFGLGMAMLHFLFGPDVQRVDPTVLTELRTIGRVVGEDTETLHQWENSYVEFTYLVVHLDSSAKEDVLDEAELRLKRSGWRVQESEPHESRLEPPRETITLVTVEPLETADFVDSDLREAVAASGLPKDEMVYVTLQG